MAATGAVTLTAAPAAGASGSPVTITAATSPVTVAVGVPVSNLLPGQDAARTFELTNATSTTLPAVAVTISPQGASALFAAGGVTAGVSTCATAWQLSSTAPGGFVCPGGGTQTSPVPLTTPATVAVATNLAAGASTWVATWFALPLSAGNQYESSTGTVNVTLVSTELPPAPAQVTPPSTPVAPPPAPPKTAPVGAITTDEGLWTPPPSMWWGLIPLALLVATLLSQGRRYRIAPVKVRTPAGSDPQHEEVRQW